MTLKHMGGDSCCVERKKSIALRIHLKVFKIEQPNIKDRGQEAPKVADVVEEYKHLTAFVIRYKYQYVVSQNPMMKERTSHCMEQLFRAGWSDLGRLASECSRTSSVSNTRPHERLR